MSASTKRLVIAVTCMAAICAAWYFLMYRPKLLMVTELEQKKQEMLAKIRSLRVTDNELVSTEQKVMALRQALAQTQASLISLDDLEFAVKQIRRHGERFGLRFDKIIPDYDSLITVSKLSNTNSSVQRLTLHLSLRGKYMNFGRFLESLTTLPFLVSLGDVNVIYHNGMFPELELMADAELFIVEKKENGQR